MPNELPNLGADIVLEFQQSINNIKLFGEAMEELDSRFGNIERRIDGLRASLSSLSSQVSRGSGRNLRAELERELNNLITENGIVVSKIGTAGLKVDANTVRQVFNKVESEINTLLARVYQNIVIDINPHLQVGKVPISKDDFDEVNKAIARLVRVQLNNLVSALQKHGAGLISAQDMSNIQFHIGKSTVQQIVNRLKEHIKEVLLRPVVDSSSVFEISERDLSRVFRTIKDKVNEAVNKAVDDISSRHQVSDLAPNIARLYDAIEDSARDYIRSVTQEINSIGRASLTRPINQLSSSLKRHMARELGVSVSEFSRAFADHQFTIQDIHAAELRRQFARLEQALNRKIGGGLSQEVKEIVNAIEKVEISYSPRLHQHLTREINHINNQIVKKIREQIDIQFAHMRAEIEGIQVAPKDINRSRRIRQMSTVEYEGGAVRPREQERTIRTLANDPYARRDEYFNSFGLRGALINTLRHILAGSIVGTPIMLLYQAFESFKTTQLEQLKMFSNLYVKASATTEERAAQGDFRSAREVVTQAIEDIMPFVQNAAQYYSIDYGQMAQVASIGSRLLDTPAEIKKFTDIVGRIYSIDREGDPVESVAPGLEAIMGQFDLAVGELEENVVRPLAVATNETNATTEAILNALMRSGSTFKTSDVSAADAIAMVATSIKFTGLSGENIGNFYKSILPRLQSESSLKELDRIGVRVYDYVNGVPVARSASQILEDVAQQYRKLNDPDSRAVIMSLFGTYQSAKGMTTLDEFEEFIRISGAMKNFTSENIEELLTNNLLNPYTEMHRASVSVNMALASVIQALTPEIVKLSQAISNVAAGIREHKETIGNMLGLLVDALLGFATVYGLRRLGNAVGIPGAIGRVETVDRILGNDSRVEAWRRENRLARDFSGISQISADALANNRSNRRFLSVALRDPELAPVIKNLSNLTDEQVRNVRNYIQDTNRLVFDMKDLIIAVEEGKDYQQKRQLTDDERWGGSQYTARRLYKEGMVGLDKDFIEAFAQELQDRQNFDQLDERGRKITTFLAGLDETEQAKFRKHLEDIHRESGLVVRDMEGLERAVDSYTAAQARNAEELRRTNPQIVALSNNLDRVSSSLNSANLQSGMTKWQTFFANLSQGARGVTSAIGGMLATVGRFAGQLALFAGIGELIGDLSYTVTSTKEERNLNMLEKEMRDFQKMSEILDDFTSENYNWFRTTLGSTVRGVAEVFVGAWDLITSPSTDKYFDTKDRQDMMYAILKYAREQGFDVDESDAYTGGWYSGQVERDLVKQIEERGMTVDEFLTKMSKDLGEESPIEQFRKKQTELSKKRYEELMLQEEEQRAIQEGVRQRAEERRQKDLLEGRFRTFDLESLKSEIEKKVEDIEAETTIKRLQLLTQGYASDSEKFIEERERQNEQINKLYQDVLDNIKAYIKDLENTVKLLKKNGADPKEIQEAQDELIRWQNNLKEAEKEFGGIMAQRNYDQEQRAFDAAMSRINRAASIAEFNRSMQEAVNSLTMDRNSVEYYKASEEISRQRINDLQSQIAQLRSAATNPDLEQQVATQIAQMQAQIEQERVKIRDLRLATIGLYRQDLQDSLAEISNEYLRARVNMGAAGLDESNPVLRNLRIEQYEKQISMFDSVIADLKARLNNETDVEAQKAIQREIRDLQRQSLEAQLGILDEMRNTGGTFNLPDNVKAMSYYEYITRNNTHSTYTVQGGDTHVTITLPNITDGTSIERIRQIGRAIGEGINEGKSLRLQKQANPFGYRG